MKARHAFIDHQADYEGVAVMLCNSTLRAKWLLLTLLSAGVILFSARQESRPHLDLIKPARSEPLHKVTDLSLRLSIRSRMLGEGINSAALSPDGNHVAIGSLLSRHIIIWDIKNNREHLRIDTGKGAPNRNSVTWSPDARFVTDGRPHRRENIVRLWNPIFGNVERQLPFPFAGGSAPARFRQDGKQVVMRFSHSGGAGDSDFSIFDMQTGERHDYRSDIGLQAVHWAGNKLVLIGGWPTVRDGQVLDGAIRHAGEQLVRVIDPSGKDPSVSMSVGSLANSNRPLPDRGYAGIKNSAVDSDGKQLALILVNPDDSLRLESIDLGPLHRRLSLPLGHGAQPVSMAYFPGGQQLAIGYVTQAAKILNASSGELEATIPVHSSSGGLSIGPAGDILAIGSGAELLVYKTR